MGQKNEKKTTGNGNAGVYGQGKPGPGRPRGIPNKITRTFKAAVEMTLERLGPKHLYAWALENPTDFYRIAAKLIPTQTQVSGLDGEPIEYRQVEPVPRAGTYQEWLAARAVGSDLAPVADVVSIAGHRNGQGNGRLVGLPAPAEEPDE